MTVSQPSQHVGTPPTVVTCLEPGCFAAVHHLRALLCAKHAQQHRQAQILKEVQKRLLAKDVLTPILSDAAFLRPPQLQSYITGLLHVCQQSLKARRQLDRVRQMAPELAEELLQKAMLPYIDPLTNMATWNRDPAQGSLCSCPGTINPTSRLHLSGRSAFTCRKCEGLRVVSPALPPAGTPSLCLHCHQETNAQRDMSCHGCGETLHTHRNTCRPVFSTVTMPTSNIWFCPKCQLCLTLAQTRKLLGIHPIPRLLKLLPTPSLTPSQRPVRQRKRQREPTETAATITSPERTLLEQRQEPTQARGQEQRQEQEQELRREPRQEPRREPDPGSEP